MNLRVKSAESACPFLGYRKAPRSAASSIPLLLRRRHPFTLFLFFLSLSIQSAKCQALQTAEVSAPKRLFSNVEADKAAFLDLLKPLRQAHLDEGRHLIDRLDVSGHVIPGDLKFRLLIDGLKLRSEWGIDREDLQLTVSNGNTFYALSGNFLTIGNCNSSLDWFLNGPAVSKFEFPFINVGELMTQSYFDEGLLAVVEQGLHREPYPRISIWREGTSIYIESVPSEDWKTKYIGPKCTIRFDEEHGFWPVQMTYETPDRSVSSVSKMQKLADGLHFPKEYQVVTTEGSAVSLKTFVLTSVKFGDFEVDESLFGYESLGIRSGVSVEDRRKNPSRNFIWGKSPYDEKVLAEAIVDGREPENRNASRLMILVMNLGLCLLVVLFFFLKRTKSGP
ncbi:MAG: hypothetical protein JNM43_06890 [Planctomycetaceae bacterium]|nr:hypothetical protein [Planctomycetaceae bacterium]